MPLGCGAGAGGAGAGGGGGGAASRRHTGASLDIRAQEEVAFMLEDMDSWRRGPAVRYFFFSFTSSSSTPSSWMPPSRKG